MLPKIVRCLLLLSTAQLVNAQNEAPVIQQISTDIDWDTQVLTLHYDATDAENDTLEVWLEFSGDGGKTYSLTDSVQVSGDVGYPVVPGMGLSITCDVSALKNNPGGVFLVRLVVDDRQAIDLQALVNEVDSNRLRNDLNFVEGIRHRTTGLAHLDAVRDSMANLFTDRGLHSQLHTFTYNSNYTGKNVVGTAPGTVKPDSVVVVDAHYDTVSNAPGADDNGSGTVGVMEIARLLSRYPSKKTMRFIGFDLEEAGLIGSSRYMSTGIAAGEKIAGAFNFEMIGYYSDAPNTQGVPTGFNLLFPAVYNELAADQFRGNSIINVGVSAFPEVHSVFSSSAAAYVPGLKVLNLMMSSSVPVPDLLRSDHASFWSASHPAVMLTDGAEYRNKCYHTASDTLDDKLNFTFMANVVKATLAAAAQLAEIRHGAWATATFAGFVGVLERFNSLGVSLLQNPSGNGHLGIVLTNCPARHLSFSLIDAQGKVVYREKREVLQANEVAELAIPHLPGGLYFLNIQAEEGLQTLKVALY